LKDVCEDVVYTGHWLVFPRPMRYSRPLNLFVEWIAKELGIELKLEALDGLADYGVSSYLEPDEG
jgi:hypothetical protein